MLITAYKNENGKSRFIAYRTDDYSESFYLYGITIEGSPNDSVIVSLKLLSEIEEKKQSKTDQIFESNLICFYESKVLKKYALITTKIGGVAQGYNIIADKFGSAVPAPIGTLQYSTLQGSIDGDSIEDFIIAGSIKKNNR